MSQFGRNLKQIVAGSALIAALAAALLPGGYLPKIAGPCGRELCSCPFTPEVEVSTCSDCKVTHSQHADPEFRLVESSITEVEEPGVALQVIFSGMLAAEKNYGLWGLQDSLLESPTSRSFHLVVHSRDLGTPPPRA